MRWLKWAACAALLFIVVSLIDSGFRTLLKGDVTVNRLDGKRDNDTLIVYLPGLVADGEWSGRQLTDTWRDFGDVWLVNPSGNRFESDLLVEQLERELEEDDHRHVIIIGSSLGAHNALEVLERLSPEKRQETQFDMFAVCSPGEGTDDLQPALKIASGAASVFRFGPITNNTWGKLYTRAITGEQPRTFAMTYYIDQVNYVRSRPAPNQEIMADMNVVYLQAEHDEIVASSAASAWTSEENVVVVKTAKHVSYDAHPEEWNEAFRAALGRLT